MELMNVNLLKTQLAFLKRTLAKSQEGTKRVFYEDVASWLSKFIFLAEMGEVSREELLGMAREFLRVRGEVFGTGPFGYLENPEDVANVACLTLAQLIEKVTKEPLIKLLLPTVENVLDVLGNGDLKDNTESKETIELHHFVLDQQDPSTLIPVTDILDYAKKNKNYFEEPPFDITEEQKAQLVSLHPAYLRSVHQHHFPKTSGLRSQFLALAEAVGKSSAHSNLLRGVQNQATGKGADYNFLEKPVIEFYPYWRGLPAAIRDSIKNLPVNAYSEGVTLEIYLLTLFSQFPEACPLTPEEIRQLDQAPRFLNCTGVMSESMTGLVRKNPRLFPEVIQQSELDEMQRDIEEKAKKRTFQGPAYSEEDFFAIRERFMEGYQNINKVYFSRLQNHFPEINELEGSEERIEYYTNRFLDVSRDFKLRVQLLNTLKNPEELKEVLHRISISSQKGELCFFEKGLQYLLEHKSIEISEADFFHNEVPNENIQKNRRLFFNLFLAMRKASPGAFDPWVMSYLISRGDMFYGYDEESMQKVAGRILLHLYVKRGEEFLYQNLSLLKDISPFFLNLLAYEGHGIKNLSPLSFLCLSKEGVTWLSQNPEILEMVNTTGLNIKVTDPRKDIIDKSPAFFLCSSPEGRQLLLESDTLFSKISEEALNTKFGKEGTIKESIFYRLIISSMGHEILLKQKEKLKEIHVDTIKEAWALREVVNSLFKTLTGHAYLWKRREELFVELVTQAQAYEKTPSSQTMIWDREAVEALCSTEKGKKLLSHERGKLAGYLLPSILSQPNVKKEVLLFLYDTEAGRKILKQQPALKEFPLCREDLSKLSPEERARVETRASRLGVNIIDRENRLPYYIQAILDSGKELKIREKLFHTFNDRELHDALGLMARTSQKGELCFFEKGLQFLIKNRNILLSERDFPSSFLYHENENIQKMHRLFFRYFVSLRGTLSSYETSYFSSFAEIANSHHEKNLLRRMRIILLALSVNNSNRFYEHLNLLENDLFPALLNARSGVGTQENHSILYRLCFHEQGRQWLKRHPHVVEMIDDTTLNAKISSADLGIVNHSAASQLFSNKTGRELFLTSETLFSKISTETLNTKFGRDERIENSVFYQLITSPEGRQILLNQKARWHEFHADILKEAIRLPGVRTALLRIPEFHSFLWERREELLTELVKAVDEHPFTNFSQKNATQGQWVEALFFTPEGRKLLAYDQGALAGCLLPSILSQKGLTKEVFLFLYATAEGREILTHQKILRSFPLSQEIMSELNEGEWNEVHNTISEFKLPIVSEEKRLQYYMDKILNSQKDFKTREALLNSLNEEDLRELFLRISSEKRGTLCFFERGLQFLFQNKNIEISGFVPPKREENIRKCYRLFAHCFASWRGYLDDVDFSYFVSFVKGIDKNDEQQVLQNIRSILFRLAIHKPELFYANLNFFTHHNNLSPELLNSRSLNPEYENLSMFHLLCKSNTGHRWLQENPTIVDMVEESTLNALVTCPSKNIYNTSAAFLLTKLPEGRQLLLTSETLFSKISTESLNKKFFREGRVVNSIFYQLITSPEGREILLKQKHRWNEFNIQLIRDAMDLPEVREALYKTPMGQAFLWERREELFEGVVNGMVFASPERHTEIASVLCTTAEGKQLLHHENGRLAARVLPSLLSNTNGAPGQKEAFLFLYGTEAGETILKHQIRLHGMPINIRCFEMLTEDEKIQVLPTLWQFDVGIRALGEGATHFSEILPDSQIEKLVFFKELQEEMQRLNVNDTLAQEKLEVLRHLKCFLRESIQKSHSQSLAEVIQEWKKQDPEAYPTLQQHRSLFFTFGRTRSQIFIDKACGQANAPTVHSSLPSPSIKA